MVLISTLPGIHWPWKEQHLAGIPMVREGKPWMRSHEKEQFLWREGRHERLGSLRQDVSSEETERRLVE